MTEVEDPAPGPSPSSLDAGAVVVAQGTSATDGLTPDEAARRLERHGPNLLDVAPPVPAWQRFAAQFRDPLVLLLAGAIAVSLVAWIIEGGEGVPVEAVVIGAIVLANGVLGFIQERGAERAVAALQRMVAPTATVVRGGLEVGVPAADVVPGDLMVVSEGDAISADARLIHASALTVAEASLTGESEPVVKDAATLPGPVPLGDRLNMVFSGTAVTRGRGTAVVTATGMRTEMGRIATLLGSTPEERTPLQREIDVVGRTLGLAVVAIAVLIVGSILATSPIRGPSQLVEVLLIGVSLAVAAVPEGLPAILTVILAIGVRRMARRNAIVKKLSSVETLGSASVIATDKTGTLTRNEMTVVRVATHSGVVEITGIGHGVEGEVLVDGHALARGPLYFEIRAVLGGGSLAGDASLVEVDGAWAVRGDPTEAAFLVAEHKLGTTAGRRARFRRRGEIPFSSERRLMSSLEADAAHDQRIVVMSKGAPDIVLDRCTHERVGASVRRLTDERRRRILASVDDLADEALRTLGVAYRALDVVEPPPAEESLEHDLVFAGVVGMIDPPRPEAAASIAEARGAGIRVVMITGDHVRTAARIADQLGIGAAGDGGGSPPAALDGPSIEAMADAELRDAARRVSVYARVAPEHKLRIVDALQADGSVVAMTGDGVNDAPALRSADIGVAMGISGSDVAKEAARMILADDNFATIVAAVREGRAIFANIRTFLRYLLGSNAGEVLTMFLGVLGASVIGLDRAGEAVIAPLLATQILWINLLTDSAPALALGFEPPGRDVMRRPPRRIGERVIDRSMTAGVVFIGVVMAIVTLLTLDAWLPGGLIAGDGTVEEARTMAFTVLVVAQLFNALNARSGSDSAFRDPFRNPRLWGALALSLGLQLLVVHLPLLNAAFGTVPLEPGQWGLAVASASAVLWAEELRKGLLRLRPAPRP